MKETYIGNTLCQSCGSKDGVGVYKRDDDSVHGWCFKCSASSYNINTSKLSIQKQDKTKRIAIALKNISNLKYNELKSRGISKEIAEYYGVKSKLDSEGKDISHYYPQCSKNQSRDIKQNGYMERRVETKTFCNISNFTDFKFFGQTQCGNGGKMIVVTEGQCDAMAVKQMFKAVGKNYRVVSVPNGAGSAIKCFKRNFDWINRFETIVLAFDMDDPGQKNIEEISNLFEVNKVKSMRYSEKDPNAMLLSDKTNEFIRSLFDSEECHTEGIRTVEELYDEALKPIQVGYSYPWEPLTRATYGYRRAEIIGIGGGSGSGKTNAFKEIIDHIIFTHKLPVGIIFLEEPAAKTLKVLAGKHMNKLFHIPDEDWTIEELKKGLDDLKGMLYLFDHFGSKDWSSIKTKIRYMVRVLGIKDIFLDHLTALVAQEDNEYTAMNKIMEELSSLANELDCTIFYISHLRKADGISHEEGGIVRPNQFRGSGAISFWSYFLFGIERNQQAKSFEDRNTTTWRVLKDRNSGLSTGFTFKLFYDHKIGRWIPINEEEFKEEL